MLSVRIFQAFSGDESGSFFHEFQTEENWVSPFQAGWKPPETFSFIMPENIEFTGAFDKDEDSSVSMVEEGVSRVFYVDIPSHKNNEQEVINIYIDSYRAFGDGSHPTTGICIDLLGRYLYGISEEKRSGLSVADAGTGSGILSIMTEKTGVEQIDAFDISPEAVRAAEINSVFNKSKINIELCDIEKFYKGESYDIVIANIVTDVFINNIKALLRLLKKEGTLIASGISAARADDAKACFISNGLKVKEIITWRGWLGFFLKLK